MPKTEKQPDLGEFFKHSAPKKRPCTIGHILSELDGEPAEQLEAALATNKHLITAGGIVKWCHARDYDYVNTQHVVQHRNEKCSCYTGFPE